MTTMSTDLEDIEARRLDRQAHPSHDCPDAVIVDADIHTLIDELRRSRAEVQLLLEGEADLRASAEIWCRLYEASLARANAAETTAEHVRDTLPDTVKNLYAALDRVAAVTKALGAVVRECSVCARDACDDVATVARTMTDACRRCASAIDALQSQGR
jgi:hypothetical protein